MAEPPLPKLQEKENDGQRQSDGRRGREEGVRDIAEGELLLVSLVDGLLESLGGLLLTSRRDGAGGVVEADLQAASALRAAEEATSLELGLVKDTAADEVVDGGGVDVVKLDSGQVFASLEGDGAGDGNGGGGEGNDEGSELHDEDYADVKSAADRVSEDARKTEGKGETLTKSW